MKRTFPIVFAACASAPVLAQELTTQGGGTPETKSFESSPLETRNYRSLSSMFLRIEPRGSVLPKGERNLTYVLTLINDIRRQGGGKIDEDYELDRLGLRFRQGIGNRWDVSAELPLLSRGGGIMDPFIEAWHQLVLGGIAGNIRTGGPFGRSYIRVPGASFGSASGFGDITLAATHQLTPRLQNSFSLKLPTGRASELLGSGALDFGVAFQYETPFGHRWNLSTQLGMVAQGKATYLPNTRRYVHQEALSLGFRATSKDYWVLQWQSEASATVTGIPSTDASHRILSMAWKRKIGARQLLEVFFSEDGDWLNYRVPELVNIGPDFTGGIRYTRRF